VETVEFRIRGLNQDSFATYLGLEPKVPFDEAEFTNKFVYSVAPLDRTDTKKGNWYRRLTGIGEAPTEIPFITHVDDLANTHFEVGYVSDNKLIMGVTNVIGNVTNIIVGIPVPTPDLTNTVSTFFWAPLHALTAKPSAASYRRKGLLSSPDVTPPSPGATARISVRYSGNDGRSVFDIRASKLLRGQEYHVWIADTTNQTSFVLIDAGIMTPSPSAGTVRFVRDTKFGDPLPQQERDAGDLSHRVIQIRDKNARFIHLEGVIP
jgi:hypothetical protein